MGLDFAKIGSGVLKGGVQPLIEKATKEKERKSRAGKITELYTGLYEDADPTKAKIAGELKTYGINVGADAVQKRPDLSFMKLSPHIQQAYDTRVLGPKEAMTMQMAENKRHGISTKMTKKMSEHLYDTFPEIRERFEDPEQVKAYFDLLEITGKDIGKELLPSIPEAKPTRVSKVIRDISQGEYASYDDFVKSDPDGRHTMLTEGGLSDKELRGMWEDEEKNTYGGMKLETAWTKAMSTHNTEKANLFGDTGFTMIMPGVSQPGGIQEDDNTFTTALKNWMGNAEMDPAKKAFFERYYSKDGQISTVKVLTFAKEMAEPIKALGLRKDEAELLDYAVKGRWPKITEETIEKINEDYKAAGLVPPTYDLKKLNQALDFLGDN